MQLIGFLPVVRRWWRLMLAAALLTGLAGYLIGSRVAPTYEARTELLVGPINTDLDTVRAAGQVAQTYAELATSAPLLSATARELRLPLRPGELKPRVQATADDLTRVLTIRVHDGSPILAARIADTLAGKLAALSGRRSGKAGSPDAGPLLGPEVRSFFVWKDRRWYPGQREAFIRFVGGRKAFGRWRRSHLQAAHLVGYQGAVEPVAGTGPGTTAPGSSGVGSPPAAGRLQVLSPAQARGTRIGPQLSLLVPLAALTGLLATLTLALLADSSSARIKTGEELAEVTQAAFLGSIGGVRRRSGGRGRPLVVEARPRSHAAASYRLLAAKIGSSDGERPLRSLLVVGTEDGPGSGELAANLAAVLSSGGRRVTFIDLDGDRSEIASLLGLQEDYGAAGGDVLEAGRAKGLLERLLKKADLIVLGGAPVDRSPGTLVWARTADATLLVADRDRTKRDSVSNAVQSLRLVGATLIGTVMSEPSERSLETVLGRLARQGRREASLGRVN